MPLFQRRFTIAAASVNDNLLANSQWEFVTDPAAQLMFGLVGDANAADLRVDVYSGTDLLAEELEPSSAARMPIFPDDYTLSDIAVQGDRLKVRVRNNHATLTRDVFLGLRIDAVPV